MIIKLVIILIFYKITFTSSFVYNTSYSSNYLDNQFNNHAIYRREIFDQFNRIQKNLTNNQTIIESFLPPILGRAMGLIKNRFSIEKGETVDESKTKKHKNQSKNGLNQPVSRKRKFKVDVDKLNTPISGRSLGIKADKSKSKSLRPIVRLDNLNSKDPFGIKSNSPGIKNEEELCNQQIELTNLPIKIRSPNYHNGNYPPNSDCTYNLTSPETPYVEQIKLNIISLELEDSRKCEHDYLEILNTSIRFCGDLKNKVFYLNQSSAILNFRSDIITELKGFEIELSIENEFCKSLIKLNEYEKSITSPNYPKNYPDSVDCWTLVDGENLQLEYAARNPNYDNDLSIEFTFQELQMEPDVLCNIDFVELFEVDPESLEPRSSLGRFCEFGKYIRIVGDKASKKNQIVTIGNQVHSRHPYLYVHFKTDKLINSRGFKAKIEVKEKQIASRKNQTCDFKADTVDKRIVSPNFPKPYQSNLDCSLLVEAPDDQLIQLNFDRFILEPDTNCAFDRLEIYEPFHSLKIRSKRSPISNQRANLDNLDFRRFLIGNQVIRTGNYGENKSNRKEKKTQLQKPINVLARTLELDKPVESYCGKKEPGSKYVSKSSRIVLRFTSDDFGEYTGFSISYKFITKNEARQLNENVKDKEAEKEQKDLVEYEFEPKDASVSIGSSFLLKCKPKGYSKLNMISKTQNDTIKWFKDDNEILSDLNEDKTVYRIKEFHASSKGSYKCKFGKSYRQAWLDVKNQTDCNILFQRRPQDLVTTEGDYPILECAAVSVTNTQNSVNFNSNNKIKISWFHNDKSIKFDQNIQLLPNNHLLLSDIKKENSGYYSCQIEDHLNSTCQKTSIAYVQVRSKINVDQLCGQSMISKNRKQSVQEFSKIVGGSEATRGKHPWQVMFYDGKRSTFCGGSLLNERWIATAAHCFKNSPQGSPPPPLSQIVVKLGKHDQNEKEPGEMSTQINEIYFYPEYNLETFDNDLALIQVKDHITFNDYIQPICLGTPELAERNFFNDIKGRSMNVERKMGYVTGWGQVRENGPQPRYMQELKVPLVPMEDCRSSTTFKVTSNMFCAGYGQDTIGDSCKGDSGSGFTVKLDDERYYLVGIVSWGEGCGKLGKFGFYTKIKNYLDWIHALIQL